MPILFWIATLACMLEMPGVLPSARTMAELDRGKEPAPPQRV